MKGKKNWIHLQCLILVGMICLPYTVYADSVFPDTIYQEYEKPDYSDGAVSIEDVLEWNTEYLSGNETEENYHSFFSKKSVPMIMTMNNFMYYAVMDGQGEYTYRIYQIDPYSSSDRKGVYLCNCITIDSISLTSSEREVREFIERQDKAKQEIREKTAYILENLDETEYGGINYYGEEKVYISLINEKRREELEDEGIGCESVSCSLEEKYNAMEELWNKKEELGIIDIDIGGREIVVYGNDTEEAFRENIKNCGYDFSYRYARAMWYVFGTREEEYFSEEMKQADLECAKLDLEKPESFVEYLRLSSCGYADYVNEWKWEALEKAISVFKQKYPEYSCRNIYYHVAGDYNADVYLNFDNELLEFVDTLPDYEADKNVVTEYEYGDSQRLELKRMLRQYREMFPEMSYAEIYKTYIKETEESTQISKEEKLYWYLWKKYSGEVKNTTSKAVRTEQFIEDGVESRENNKQSIYPAVIGFGILIAGCVVVFGIKMKRNQI